MSSQRPMFFLERNVCNLVLNTFKILLADFYASTKSVGQLTVCLWLPGVSPEMVTCLRGHTGLVKGLTWDPVGKYIASQADDHSLKVWRTVDWQLEANITKPFNEVTPFTAA